MYITLFIFGLLIHCEIPKSLTFLFIDLCNVRLTFKKKKNLQFFEKKNLNKFYIKSNINK